MDLDDIDEWNLLRIEHEHGTAEPAVAGGGVVRGEVRRDMRVRVDPSDAYTGGDSAELRKYDDDDTLYFVADPSINDDDEEYVVESIDVLAEDVREDGV